MGVPQVNIQTQKCASSWQITKHWRKSYTVYFKIERPYCATLKNKTCSLYGIRTTYTILESNLTGEMTAPMWAHLHRMCALVTVRRAMYFPSIHCLPKLPHNSVNAPKMVSAHTENVQLGSRLSEERTKSNWERIHLKHHTKRTLVKKFLSFRTPGVLPRWLMLGPTAKATVAGSML